MRAKPGYIYSGGGRKRGIILAGARKSSVRARRRERLSRISPNIFVVYFLFLTFNKRIQIGTLLFEFQEESDINNRNS